jgi:hypothetical protein
MLRLACLVLSLFASAAEINKDPAFVYYPLAKGNS